MKSGYFGRLYPVLKTAVVAFMLTALFVQLGSAQSGRRNPNYRKPSSDETTTVKAPEEQEKKEDKEKKEISILLAGPMRNASMYSDSYADIVARTCAERLGQVRGVRVHAEREMNRKEASDRAKSATSGYVVSIDMEGGYDSMSGSSSEVFVTYYVFANGTGKVKQSGRVYLSSADVGRGPVGVGVPIPRTQAGTWYLLERLGRSTADRILASLGLAIPPGQ